MMRLDGDRHGQFWSIEWRDIDIVFVDAQSFNLLMPEAAAHSHKQVERDDAGQEAD